MKDRRAEVHHARSGSISAQVSMDGKPDGGGRATLQKNPVGKPGWRNVASRNVPKSGQVVFSHAPSKDQFVPDQVSSTGTRKAPTSATVRTKVRAAVSVNSSIVAFTGQKVRLTGSVTLANARCW